MSVRVAGRLSSRREHNEQHLVRDGAAVIAAIFGGCYAALFALAAIL